jgi:hypothetical protein
MHRHPQQETEMAKKKTARAKKTTASKKKTSSKKAATAKKAAKRSKAVRPGRARPLKRQPLTKSAKKAKVPKRAPMLDYGPTFFLTAQSDTAPAYEIDGTPHHRTVRSYRMERAAIMEFEEQDGKILYKVKPLMSPAS